MSREELKQLRPQGVVQEGKLSPAVLDILQLTNISHNGTLPSVVEATQKEWLRKAGTERWEMDNAREDLGPSITPLFMQLGIIDEIAPTHKHYTYGIILGSPMNDMRNRFAYALELWNRGVRFDHLVFLVGARPLDPTEESEAVLYDRNNDILPIRPDWKKPKRAPKTETDASKLLFDQSILSRSFRESVKVTFIDTPMQPLPDGKLRRPNTDDTVNLFKPMLELHPGTILAISDQPDIGYQAVILRTLLKDYSVETVGPKAREPVHVGITLDAIARWLYSENKSQQSLNK